MAHKDIDLGRINIESSGKIQLTIKKNDVAWTGLDAVEITLIRGSTELGPFDCVLDSSNIWYYDVALNDIVTPGQYRIRVRVTDGALETTYPYEIALKVVEQ